MLENSVILVTGANGGIGRALCHGLKQAKATVIATDIKLDEKQIDADVHFTHDVTKAEDWAALAQLVKSKFGRLDAMVNNAGISVVAPIEATDIATWQRVQAVNVESILLGQQAMLELLKESGKTRKGGASIVNISSIGGQLGAAFNAAYCASKGAVKIFTKCAAIEFAALKYNIRVNSIHPGGVETPMLAQIIQTYVDMGVIPNYEQAHSGILAAHPLGRMAEPNDIVGGVVYLCSEASAFVTGSELNIDGGFAAI